MDNEQKINIEDLHEKVVWLNVPMNKVFAMYVFYPRNELIGQQKDRLEAESS